MQLLYAATGFLLVRRSAYEKIERQLALPKCNLQFGKAMIPWFQPLVIEQPTFPVDGTLPENPAIKMTPLLETPPAPAVLPPPSPWYLAEDYAFCERARQCGIAIWADTRIRLSHVGTYAFTWEDAGADRPRYSTYTYNLPGESSTKTN